MHRAHTSHPDQDLLLSSTTRIYQMHKKTQLVPGTTTEACHVLWLLEILQQALHRGCLCVPLQGQGISSCIPCLSGIVPGHRGGTSSSLAISIDKLRKTEPSSEVRGKEGRTSLWAGWPGRGAWPPAARFLCFHSHYASGFHPFLFSHSTKSLVVTFGKENVDAPVVLTLRRADTCSLGSREELVLNSCALFSNALLLVMRSRGFHTDTRGKPACGEMHLWETGLKLSQNRPEFFL